MSNDADRFEGPIKWFVPGVVHAGHLERVVVGVVQRGVGLCNIFSQFVLIFLRASYLCLVVKVRSLVETGEVVWGGVVVTGVVRDHAVR